MGVLRRETILLTVEIKMAITFEQTLKSYLCAFFLHTIEEND